MWITVPFLPDDALNAHSHESIHKNLPTPTHQVRLLKGLGLWVGRETLVLPPFVGHPPTVASSRKGGGDVIAPSFTISYYRVEWYVDLP